MWEKSALRNPSRRVTNHGRLLVVLVIFVVIVLLGLGLNLDLVGTLVVSFWRVVSVLLARLRGPVVRGGGLFGSLGDTIGRHSNRRRCAPDDCGSGTQRWKVAALRRFLFGRHRRRLGGLAKTRICLGLRGRCCLFCRFCGGCPRAPMAGGSSRLDVFRPGVISSEGREVVRQGAFEFLLARRPWRRRFALRSGNLSCLRFLFFVRLGRPRRSSHDGIDHILSLGDLLFDAFELNSPDLAVCLGDVYLDLARCFDVLYCLTPFPDDELHERIIHAELFRNGVRDLLVLLFREAVDRILGQLHALGRSGNHYLTHPVVQRDIDVRKPVLQFLNHFCFVQPQALHHVAADRERLECPFPLDHLLDLLLSLLDLIVVAINDQITFLTADLSAGLPGDHGDRFPVENIFLLGLQGDLERLRVGHGQ
mmetsp:Transcript_43854/g.121340  ORF Transcript_43854/g.121340 Transcript_43854/m.121340 type:complete len:422 (-) Transcript_43854:1677-2942(-)